MSKSKQVWQPIKDHPGYEVSDCGEVRRVHETCALSQKQDENGLFYVILHRGEKRIRRWVHVLVAETFNGHPMGHKVVHLDENRWNNRSDNLVWQPS